MAHQSKKSRVELPHSPRYALQGHSFWLAVWLNMGLGVGFFLPHPQWLCYGTIGSAFLLAGQSEPCIQESGPPWKKEIGRSKAGSAGQRLEALATLMPPLLLYPETSTWPFQPQLICSKQTRCLLLLPVNLSFLTPNWNPLWLLYMILIIV